MPKPIKTRRASEPVTPDANGQWLVLIGDSGETSADDIEAFFADIWPDVEPAATIHAIPASPAAAQPRRACASRSTPRPHSPAVVRRPR